MSGATAAICLRSDDCHGDVLSINRPVGSPTVSIQNITALYLMSSKSPRSVTSQSTRGVCSGERVCAKMCVCLAREMRWEHL